MTSVLRGQISIEYLDAKSKITDREHAVLYREITYDKNGKPKGKVRHFYVSGELNFEGQLISIAPDIVDGFCTWYYQNGQKKQEGLYLKGELIEEVRQWSPEGKEEGVIDTSGYFFTERYLGNLLIDFSELFETDLSLDSLSFEKLRRAGIHYFDSGLYPSAMGLWKMGHDICKKLGVEARIGVFYHNLGLAIEKSGRHLEALSYYEKAVNKRKEPESESALATTYQNMGATYVSLGKFSEALSYFHKSKTIREKLGDPKKLADAFNGLGYVYSSMGNNTQAIDFYQKATLIRDSLGIKKELAVSYSNLGSIHFDLGQYGKALDLYSKAKEIRERFPTGANLGNTYNNLGEVYFAQSKYDSALHYYKKAVVIQVDRYIDVDLARTYGNLAKFFFHYSQPDSALVYAQKTIRLTEKIRSLNKSKTDRQLLVSNSIDVIEIGLLSAYQLNLPETVFELSEKGKARGLADLLTEKSISLKEIPESFRKSHSVIQNKLDATNNQLTQKISDKKRNKLVRIRDSLYNRIQEVEDQIRIFAPEYSNLVYPETVDYLQLQAVLKKKEVLICFFNGQYRTFGLVLTKKQLQVIDLGPSAILKTLVDDLQNQFIGTRKENLQQKRLSVLSMEKEQSFFFSLSANIHQSLWVPIEATGLLKSKKIVIVPDGFFNYLPFEILVKDREELDYGEYNYLIKQYAISYYPSASVLYNERIKKKIDQNWQTSFFGLALNNFEGNHCNEGDITFANLDSSVSEIMAIAHQFPGSSFTVKGSQATESFLKSQHLLPYRYLHLSTHGLINTKKPEFSRLLLTPDDFEDGCLNLYEIFDLNFNADLISLSACGTGLGQLVRGEGIVGFTRALMYSGTPSVVLSLWEVVDESTKELFVDYYSGLAKNSNNKYAPLRAAQLKMINKGGEYSNPYYWAPFIFIGEQ